MDNFLRHIFPTPIFHGVCSNEEIRQKICDLAYKFKASGKRAGLVSEAWNSNSFSEDQKDFDEHGVTSFYSTNLVQEEEWQEVCAFIYDFAKTMMKNVYHCDDLIINNMWTTIYPKGAFVPQHIHDNTLLSGVFYAKAKENCGDLVFEDPAHVAKNMASRRANIFPTLPTRYTHKVEEGGMVLFPAWLPHHTKQNKSEDDRIIVSFNLGFTEDALKWAFEKP